MPPVGGVLLTNVVFNTSGYVGSTYVQISTGLNSGVIGNNPARGVYTYNGGSQPLMLGSGPSGSVSAVVQVPPGNGGGFVPILVPAGVPLWLKSLGTTGQASGVVSIDFYG